MSIIIGSHVGVSADRKMLVGAVEEALSYGANTFMFYTGAPQNTIRVPIERFYVKEALDLMAANGISLANVVVHAPYIINLANTVKPDTFELAVSFLQKELQRVEAIGCRHVVLHPGSHVGQGDAIGLDQVVRGLDLVLQDNLAPSVTILLETMSGKGSEVGYRFEHIAYIRSHVKHPERLAVCLDTCHIHDAGYDIVNDLDGVLAEFDRIIGLEHLAVIHVNDSKNPRGARKDRHENIGYGHIGFDTLYRVIHHPLLSRQPKILETPYVGDLPPYRHEIMWLQNGENRHDLPKTDINSSSSDD